MNDKIKRILTIYVAANAMTLAVLLLVFIILLFPLGLKRADYVWSVPVYTGAFVVSLFVSAKYVR
jgi:hypothetical protein